MRALEESLLGAEMFTAEYTLLAASLKGHYRVALSVVH